jgi:hypothetical protein
VSKPQCEQGKRPAIGCHDCLTIAKNRIGQRIADHTSTIGGRLSGPIFHRDRNRLERDTFVNTGRRVGTNLTAALRRYADNPSNWITSEWPTTQDLPSSWPKSTMSNAATFYRWGYCDTPCIPGLSCSTASSVSGAAKGTTFRGECFFATSKGALRCSRDRTPYAFSRPEIC